MVGSDEKTNNVSTPDRDKRFLYSHNVQRGSGVL
jgi:hypothetical protein